jgi:uncharacterized RDD family membrane protein YckC
MKKPTQVVGRRVAAFVIDALLLTAINLAVFFLFAEKRADIESRLAPGEEQAVFVNLNLGGDEYSIEGSGKALLYLLLIAALGFLYFGVLQGIKGWTLGKLALGIRVVDEAGRTGPGVGKATVRWLLWIVDGFFFYLVAFVTALASSRNQRVGDMVAKTYVVGQGDAGRPPFAEQGQFGAGGYYPQQQAQPQPAQAQTQGGGPGWHPDPHGQARLRYWDGSRWTEHTSN